SRSRHTIFSRDWSSDVCSSDLRGAASAMINRLVFRLDEADAVERDLQGCTVVPDLGRQRQQSLQSRLDDAVGLAECLPLVLVIRSEERRVGKEGSEGTSQRGMR